MKYSFSILFLLFVNSIYLFFSTVEAISALENVAEHINEMQNITEKFLPIFQELAASNGLNVRTVLQFVQISHCLGVSALYPPGQPTTLYPKLAHRSDHQSNLWTSIHSDWDQLVHCYSISNQECNVI